MARFNEYVTFAKQKKAQAEFNSLEKAVISAQILNESALKDITETTDTMADCAAAITAGLTLKDPLVHQDCLDDWRSALLKIGLASGLDISTFLLDPWGAPYLLDEGGIEDCHYNILASAGRNGDFTDETLRIEIYSPYGDPCPEDDPESSEEEPDPDEEEPDLAALDALFPEFPEPKFPLLADCYFHSSICKPDVVKCIPKKNRNGCGVKTVNFYEKIGEI